MSSASTAHCRRLPNFTRNERAIAGQNPRETPISLGLCFNLPVENRPNENARKAVPVSETVWVLRTYANRAKHLHGRGSWLGFPSAWTVTPYKAGHPGPKTSRFQRPPFERVSVKAPHAKKRPRRTTRAKSDDPGAAMRTRAHHANRGARNLLVSEGRPQVQKRHWYFCGACRLSPSSRGSTTKYPRCGLTAVLHRLAGCC